MLWKNKNLRIFYAINKLCSSDILQFFFPVKVLTNTILLIIPS